MDRFVRKKCQKKRKDVDYNFCESFFKNISLCMNGRLSKIRSVHTYVITRMVYFDRIYKVARFSKVYHYITQHFIKCVPKGGIFYCGLVETLKKIENFPLCSLLFGNFSNPSLPFFLYRVAARYVHSIVYVKVATTTSIQVPGAQYGN